MYEPTYYQIRIKITICQTDSIMTLNSELCQSELIIAYHKIVKNLFLCTYVDQVAIQQRLNEWSNFSFIIFSVMFFPLFWKVFIDILKIYELPWIYNKLPKYCNNHLPGQFYVPTSYGFWTIPLLTLLKMGLRRQTTLLALNLKKILVRIFFQNVGLKETFFRSIRCCPYSVQETLYYVLEINIFGRDYSSLNDLFQIY